MSSKVIEQNEIILDTYFIEQAIINHVKQKFDIKLSRECKNLKWDWLAKANDGDSYFTPEQLTITRRQTLEKKL